MCDPTEMIPIITIPELWVIEDNNMWTYKLQRTENNTLVYVPPPEKSQCGKDGHYQQDEIMFFPISPDDFRKSRRTKRIAYRFLFTSTKQTRIDLPGDINVSATTDIYLTVSRVSYNTRGKHSVIIRNVYDSLFPPFGMMAETNANDMPAAIESYVHGVLDNYCPYYMLAET